MYTNNNETTVKYNDNITIIIKRDDEIEDKPTYLFCLVFANGGETNDFDGGHSIDEATEAAEALAEQYEMDPDAER